MTIEHVENVRLFIRFFATLRISVYCVLDFYALMVLRAWIQMALQSSVVLSNKYNCILLT